MIRSVGLGVAVESRRVVEEEKEEEKEEEEEKRKGRVQRGVLEGRGE